MSTRWCLEVLRTSLCDPNSWYYTRIDPKRDLENLNSIPSHPCALGTAPPTAENIFDFEIAQVGTILLIFKQNIAENVNESSQSEDEWHSLTS